jgi:type II secretory pathway component PulF
MAIEIATPAPSAAGARRELGLFRRRGVRPRDLMLFLEQLSLLLETGVTLHAALTSLRAGCANPALARVLDSIVDDIATGRSFSSALERHPEVFSRTQVSLIAASENGGFVPDVLKQLLELEEKREKLRSTLVAAAAYPAFLCVFSVAVVIFVLVVVFPQFGTIFANIKTELPITTKALMWCSDVLRRGWLPLGGLLAAAAVLAHRWAASEAGGEAIDRFKLHAPLIGGVFVKLYLVQSMRAMSLSLANGVSAVDTLVSCEHVVANRVFRRFLAGLKRDVEQGESLAVGFAKAAFVPPVVRQLIATGDASGSLPKVMGRVADFYERELEKQLALLARLAEPVMLLVMGAIVGLIVSSLILPIFSLSRGIGG